MNTQRIKKAKEKISPKRKSEEQQKFNDGQKKINGALCYVDWHVIYSIKALVKALEDAGVLTDAQLSKAKKELDLAHYTSERVASIDPPGCDPNLLNNGFEEPDGRLPKEPDIKAA